MFLSIFAITDTARTLYCFPMSLEAANLSNIVIAAFVGFTASLTDSNISSENLKLLPAATPISELPLNET